MNHWLNRKVVKISSIHVSNKTDRSCILVSRCCRNVTVYIAVLITRSIFNAEALEFFYESVGKRELILA